MSGTDSAATGIGGLRVRMNRCEGEDSTEKGTTSTQPSAEDSVQEDMATWSWITRLWELLRLHGWAEGRIRLQA